MEYPVDKNYFSPINSTVFKGQKQLPEVFYKKCVLRNFTKFTGKHLCQSLFFSEVAGLRPATLLKKKLWHRCFPVNFAKFLRTTFFIEHLWWLLLNTDLYIFIFTYSFGKLIFCLSVFSVFFVCSVF